jgi:hypothetical protein
MNSPRAPGLRLDLSSDGRSLAGKDSKGGGFLVDCRLSEDMTAEYRETLKSGLRSVKDGVSNKLPSVMDAHAALGKLNVKGLTLVSQIFGEKRRVVVDFFRQTFPQWQTSEEPVRISIVAAELGRFLPLEFLPLFELSDWPPADDTNTLAAAGRRFPGFSAIIQREFGDLNVNQDPILQNEPRLSLRCFSYRGLKGASEEEQFFTANGKEIDLEGPWPTNQIERKKFSRTLARYLRHGDERFNGTKRPVVDQIQHFACHCEVDEKVSSDSRMLLAFDNKVTIGELQAEFAVLDDRVPKFGPLIFLNACGSSEMDPMKVTSFPRFFLRDNRNRGFIGTEINVPDAFAAAFSKIFYERLLAGASLGDAIYAAKWVMLRQYNNPLGILYTVYANPELRVSRPVEHLEGKVTAERESREVNRGQRTGDGTRCDTPVVDRT